jgi:hypothetical protein
VRDIEIPPMQGPHPASDAPRGERCVRGARSQRAAMS